MTEPQTLLIEGPAGFIETIVDYPDDAERQGFVVCCHPHPLFGGTMHNKVITTVTKAFVSMGLKVVRFNFRGVGKSTGQHDKGIGECDDLRTVMQWASEQWPEEVIWLLGFSFGAYVAGRVTAEHASVEQLVMLAPPVHYDGFSQLATIRANWWIIQGESDELVSAEEVKKWANQRPETPSFTSLPATGHFFHGQLLTLRDLLKTKLNHILPPRKQRG